MWTQSRNEAYIIWVGGCSVAQHAFSCARLRSRLSVIDCGLVMKRASFSLRRKAPARRRALIPPKGRSLELVLYPCLIQFVLCLCPRTTYLAPTRQETPRHPFARVTRSPLGVQIALLAMALAVIALVVPLPFSRRSELMPASPQMQQVSDGHCRQSQCCQSVAPPREGGAESDFALFCGAD